MSYQAPYNAGHHYQDSEDLYNPYNPQHYKDAQPEAVYSNYPPPQRIQTVAPSQRPSSGFEEGEFQRATASSGSKIRSAQALRDYRRGNLCTKGGRVRCIGRICCCSLMTTVFLIVSIVLALALWIRPPSVTIGSVQPAGSSTKVTSDGIDVGLSVEISVINPNYFSVDFTKIEAELFYPINNTEVGGGSARNIVFKSRSQTNFTFPFTLSYNTTSDVDGAILKDLATKCGVDGGKKSNLSVNYKITLGIRILMATIFPVISNTFSFSCPISASEISSLLGSLHI